jgi:hypothetical protein
MRFGKLVLFFLLFSIAGFAQEITATDITKDAKANGKTIAVFGLSLGISRDEAIRIIQANPLLSYNEQSRDANDGSTRIRVFHSLVKKTLLGFRDSCVLDLIWWNSQEKSLSEISIYNSMEELLVGDTKNLLSVSALDSTSYISKNFLNPCDSSRMTLFISFYAYSEVTYYFHSKGLEIVEENNIDAEQKEVRLVITDFAEYKSR